MKRNTLMCASCSLSVLLGLVFLAGYASKAEARQVPNRPSPPGVRKDLRDDRKAVRDDRKDIGEDRKALRDDRRDIADDRSQLREDRKTGGDVKGDIRDLKADRKELRDDKKALGEDRKELRKDVGELRNDPREGGVDARQANQARRIEQGIRNGSLTPDEAAKLTAQQQQIAALEKQFDGDGKLTRNEFRTLNEQLNVSSRCIFAEKHDTEGHQMPVYRLGQNVKLNSDVAAKLADPNLDRAQARAFSHDFNEMLRIKHRLATQELTPEARAEMQAKYSNYLNQYFTVSSQ